MTNATDFVEAEMKKGCTFWCATQFQNQKPNSKNGGPPESRTRHQRIMLTTTVFTACFQFVVWTVSCLYDLPVQSLHVPNIAVWLRSGLPRCKQQRLPRIWVVLHASRVNLLTCNPIAIDRSLRFRSLTFKSAALTKHELEARKTDFSCAILLSSC